MARRKMVTGLVVAMAVVGGAGESSALSKIVFQDVDPATGSSHLFVVDSDGANLVQVTSGNPGSRADPVWSPDGTEIAYRLQTEEAASIRVMAADGSNDREVYSSSSYYAMSGIDWSPELPPNVTSLSLVSQTLSAFFLGVIATLMLLRRRGNLEWQA